MPQFFKDHWELTASICSLFWFLAGKQSSSNGSASAALFWQSVGAFIAGGLCVVSLDKGNWLGVLFGVALLCFEVPSVKRLVAHLGERSE